MVVALRLADLARDGPLRPLEGVHADDAASNDARTTRPRPVRSLSCRAATTPNAPYMPASRSAMGTPTRWTSSVRTGQRHQPRFALRDLVVARASAFGSVVTETADGQDDQSRIDLRQPLVGNPKPVKDAGAEVLHEHVGAPDEGFEGGLSVLRLEVEGDGLLVPIRGQEVGRFTLGVDRLHEGRPPSAGVVAAVGVLHLDHVGAEVAQHHRGVGARECAGQIDDHHALQGTGGFAPRVLVRELLLPSDPSD